MIEKKGYDMKKIAAMLGIIALVSYSISALIVFASGGKFFDKGVTHSLNTTKKANIATVKKIIIDASSEDITLIPSNSKSAEASAHLYGDITSTGKQNMPTLKLTRSGDTLHISIEDQNTIHFGFYSRNTKLDVVLPKSYANELEVSASSSNIRLDNRKLSALKIDVTSGDLSFDNIETESFEFDSSSGYANIKTLKAKSAIFSSTSGDTKIDSLKSETSSFESSSGSVTVHHLIGDLKASSTSGDINIEYKKFNNNIGIETSSGEVKLALPSNAMFNLTTSTSSGDVTCDFPITRTDNNDDISGSVGSSKNTIQISTTSGDIIFQKK